MSWSIDFQSHVISHATFTLQTCLPEFHSPWFRRSYRSSISRPRYLICRNIVRQERTHKEQKRHYSSGSHRISSSCYFAVNSRLALVTPFTTGPGLLFASVTRPIVLFMRVFLLVRYNRYSIVPSNDCAHCVPAHCASVFIHPAICDAMTKTNALSLAIVMYILCRRSPVQSQAIIIRGKCRRAPSERFIFRNGVPPSAIVPWVSRDISHVDTSLRNNIINARNRLIYIGECYSESRNCELQEFNVTVLVSGVN